MSTTLIPLRVFDIVKQTLSGEARYALNSVSVEKGPVALATDGQAMLAVAWEDSQPIKPQVTHAADWAAMKKIALANDKRAKSVTLDTAKAVDCTLPDMHRCVPRYDDSECTVMTMDAKRLGNLLLNMVKCMGDSGDSVVIIKVPHDANRPVLIIGGPAREPQTVLCVLMPYSSVEYNPLPQLAMLIAGGQKPCVVSKKEG